MPERPELDHQLGILRRELLGHRITAVELLDPVLLRMMVEGDLRTLLAGCSLTAVVREAHFLIFTVGPREGEPDPGLELAVNPMLAGRFTLAPPGARRTKDIGLVLGLEDGRELRYRDRRQMGKIYLVPAAQRRRVPGLQKIGVDVLSDDFTVERLAELAKKRRDQVKLFLLDKSALDALGNAYADEALFAAGIHPKARVRELGPDELARLHGAVVSVLTEAAAVVAERDAALDEKVRDFLKVRNRKGEPCPVCGEPIRVAGVRGHDAFFCARCQPDRKGRGFVNWRKR